jgi:hypothetical protein
MTRSKYIAPAVLLSDGGLITPWERYRIAPQSLQIAPVHLVTDGGNRSGDGSDSPRGGYHSAPVGGEWERFAR